MTEGPDPKTDAPPHKLSVLICEHSDPTRNRIVRAFEARGFLVFEAVNLQDACYQLGRVSPRSFVVATMKGGDAVALARGLGHLEKTKRCPVVLVLPDPDAVETFAEKPLGRNVISIARYKSADVLVNAVLEAHQEASSWWDETSYIVNEDGLAVAVALGMDPESMEALDRAFDFFAEVIDRVEKNRLPGPMMPKLLEDVRTLLADPDVAFNEIARFVRRHQSLSARLVAMANSAFYRRGGERVVTPAKAIARLGLDMTSSTLQAIAALAYVAGNDKALRRMIEENLVSAYAVANLSQLLAEIQGGVEPEDAFTIGLFYNIGSTFLLYTLALMIDKDPAGFGDIDYPSISTMTKNRAHSLNRMVVRAMNLPEDAGNLYSPLNLAEGEKEESSPGVQIVQRGMWAAEQLLAGDEPKELEPTDRAAMLGITEEAMEQLNQKLPALRDTIDEYERAARSPGR